MKKSKNSKENLLNVMYIALLSVIIGLIGTVFIDSIYTMLNSTKPKADYIVEIRNNAHKEKQNKKYENIDIEIDNIKERTQEIDNYTKQYKERIDYNNEPISSEIKDYKHNIIKEEATQKQDAKDSVEKTIIDKIDKPKMAIIIDDIASKAQLDGQL